VTPVDCPDRAVDGTLLATAPDVDSLQHWLWELAAERRWFGYRHPHGTLSTPTR